MILGDLSGAGAQVVDVAVLLQRAHASGTVRVVSGEDAYDEADPAAADRPGTTAEPLLVLVQPPPSELALPINMVDYACARAPFAAGASQRSRSSRTASIAGRSSSAIWSWL